MRSLTQTVEITAAIREGGGNTDEIPEASEQKIYAVRKGRDAKGMVAVKEILPGVLDRIGEMSESETHLPGLFTGLPTLDRKIAGLNKSNLIPLATRSGEAGFLPPERVTRFPYCLSFQSARSGREFFGKKGRNRLTYRPMQVILFPDILSVNHDGGYML